MHRPRHQLGHHLPADPVRGRPGPSSTSCGACPGRRRTTRPTRSCSTRDQHAVRRPGRQHEHGRAVEQLRLPARVRVLGRDPADRPRRDRQHDLRPADAGRRGPSRRSTGPFGGDVGKHQAKITPASPVQVYAPGLPQPVQRSCRTQAGKLLRHRQRPERRVGRRPDRRGAGRHVHERVRRARHRRRGQPAPHHRSGLLRRPPEPDPRQPGQHVQHHQPAVAGAGRQPDRVRLPRTPATQRLDRARCRVGTTGIGRVHGVELRGPDERRPARRQRRRHRVPGARWTAPATNVQATDALFSNVSARLRDRRRGAGRRRRVPRHDLGADFTNRRHHVFEPNDFGGSSVAAVHRARHARRSTRTTTATRTRTRSTTAPTPCSAADVPHDWDGDLVSDLHDPDDDNDGLPDAVRPVRGRRANGLLHRRPDRATPWLNGAENEPVRAHPDPERLSRAASSASGSPASCRTAPRTISSCSTPPG